MTPPLCRVDGGTSPSLAHSLAPINCPEQLAGREGGTKLSRVPPKQVTLEGKGQHLFTVKQEALPSSPSAEELRQTIDSASGRGYPPKEDPEILSLALGRLLINSSSHDDDL